MIHLLLGTAGRFSSLDSRVAREPQFATSRHASQAWRLFADFTPGDANHNTDRPIGRFIASLAAVGLAKAATN